jgi:serine/threonine-protein kinase SRPK3
MQTAPRPPDMRTDVWSLGCTIYAIRAGRLLFPRPTDAEEMCLNLYLTLGYSPFLAQIWPSRADWVDDNGKLKPNTPTFVTRKLLRQHIEGIGKDVKSIKVIEVGTEKEKENIERPSSDETQPLMGIKSPVEEKTWRPIPMSAAEAVSLHDLLSRMLTFDPDERITVDEVVAHPWFVTKFAS